MVRMKGGSSGAIIGLVIFILLILIGGGIGLYFLLKCAEVTETCEGDDDCCETLECKDNKCTEPSGGNGGTGSSNGGTEPSGGNGGNSGNGGNGGTGSSNGATEPSGGNSGNGGNGGNGGNSSNNCPQDWFNKEVFDKCTCSKKSDKKEKHASKELWRCISPAPCKERCNNIQKDFCKSGSIIEFNKEPLFENKTLKCCPGSNLHKPSCSNGAFKGRRWGGGAGYVGPAEGNFITRCGTHEHWYCN